jgi:hypothetical protein
MNGTATANGTKTAPQAWLQDSVRTFFERVAWDGRPLQTVTQAPDSAPTSGSPMTLSVGAFFSTIPWEGQPIIAAPVAPLEMLLEEPAPTSDALTLDAFSDLF